ncbi:NACHT, LRR and PYD domains-containing protein 3-like [Polypterus senegalus]|uniref:NACHT, LRR and PYD domains-containing protein 3-like n=1 Tax=Polypterus senegalus TaxID=55291 RepID=UPI0019653CB1|nr:NACHT, LRR and PYD domains-containing protein 3-like [Polypterus senegalus]
MSEDGLCKKFVSMISRKRRSDEDIDALSGLTQRFPKVIKTFSHEDLLKITEFYKPNLAYVIEYDITSILQNLATKNILTNDEAKRFKNKEKFEGLAGVESFISDIMKMDRLVSLWEALAEELERFPSPNLTLILEEVTEWGQKLLVDIQASLQPPTIKAHIKGLYETHKGGVSESTRSLEDQASLDDPNMRAVDFETRYTELMVIKHYKRTYSERHHELVKMGKTHAKLVEEQTKSKCERIWTEHLFRRSPGNETAPRIVFVSGVAGMGKTTIVQKIMFDWARGTQYQRFAFVFLFKFKELNLLDTEEEPQMPLTRLIVRHYKYLNDPRLKEILQEPESLLFIFDGLDEYKHTLDFTEQRLCSNPDDYIPVHTLVTSLVRRTLLKGCTVLITSRPTALEALDMKNVDRFTEILGFFPKQRLMYFQKFFGDADRGSEAFQYVEENAILYTMCFNPSYCWTICSVLKSHFMTPEAERGAAPRTVTELFVMFLHNILTNHKRQAKDQRGILIKLGKMAYYGVVNRILVFYDKFEMFTFGLQPVLSSPFLSGFLKEILQRESTLEHTTYTFYHLTLQEFMAALSYYLGPSGGIKELLEKLESSQDGQFEILTRFLAGLATPSVFKTLGGVMGDFERKTAKQVLDWVKQKAEQALWGQDKHEALRVCQWLYETQNKRLIRDAIGQDLKMDFSGMTLSPLDCAVLGSVISCCGEFEELNLKETNLTPECIRRLEPGLICCRHVNLASCRNFTELCSAFSSALTAEHSRLTELDLSWGFLGDAGVSELCKDLRDPNCKLEKLRLFSCRLTSRCCSALSSAVSFPQSQLTKLELNDNNLCDSGVKRLCKGLRSENCKLKTLRLSECSLTSECCSALYSALSDEHSRLTELELHSNKLRDSGVTELCVGLRSENCKIKRLSLTKCGLTSGCCSILSASLSAPHSRLTELQLDENKLKDSGVTDLCEGLRNTNCKLESLRLDSCHLTSGCCSALSSALSAPHSRLTDLNLSDNKLENSGVTELCGGLWNKNCKIEILSLSHCHLTSRCCSALSSAFSAPHSRLTKLELNDNKLGDSGVDQLCEGLKSENCKLKILCLSKCHLTSGCCSALSLVLSAPHSPLTELDLSINQLGDSGVTVLCKGLRSENCKLKTLSLASCHLTSRCCSALSSALSAPHSQLTELNLGVVDLKDSGLTELCEGLRSTNCKLEKLRETILYLLTLAITEGLAVVLSNQILHETGKQSFVVLLVVVICEQIMSCDPSGVQPAGVKVSQGLTQKFPKVIKSFSYDDLQKITKYYKSYLSYVIEYNIMSILQNLVTKNILTNNEAKRFKAAEKHKGRADVESFISDIMKMDRGVLVSLWEALAEEVVRFPSPNMTRILKEVTEAGPNFFQASLQPPPIKAHIKGLYKRHRGGVSESTRTLEDQPSPGDTNMRALGLETSHTELMELNLLDTEKEPQMPLTRLIVRHYKYLNDPKLREILQKPESLLFIFDGMDEYKHKLDFTEQRLCSNPDDYFTVHTLVISLVRRTLLKGCTVLITTRPTALETLNMKRVDRFAEILGFFLEQRLIYFKKFFGDADQGSEAFLYVEENAILYTMCFNSSYCWIICSVLKSHFIIPEEE